jgi:predicted amidohydrolase YtcJ
LAKQPEKKHSCLFINANLWRPEGGFNNAFGIENGLVNFSGSLSEADKIKQKYNKVIDLKGKLVLPSFTDGHVHLVKGSLMMTRIDCTEIKSPAQLKEKVHSFFSNNPEKNWLIGSNLDIATVFRGFETEKGAIRDFLDSIVSSKPLYLTNYDYHSAICNSEAIKASGLNENLKNFSRAEVPLDIFGKASGIIKEKAMGFVFDNAPSLSLEEKINAMEKMIGILHSLGLTAVSDITMPSNVEVYKKLYELGKLKMRINSYLPFEEYENYQQYTEQTKNIPKELFEIKGFKAYYDGALGSETGLFSENYNGKNYNGYKTDMASSGKLEELAKLIDKAGKQVIIHAIGDKAVSEVLDIAENLEAENGTRDRRLRIEHAQHINENDFDRFKKLNVVASAQPLHMKYDIKIVKEKLPEKIVKRTHNYKALMDLGVIVNFGTDFPIVEINPFHNIELAVTRSAGGETFLPEYKIDMHNSIKAYTINNAYASFNEHNYGLIETGKFADFIVMEDNLFEMPENEISNAVVLSTYFNGEEVSNKS